METRSMAKRRKISKLPTASFEELPDEIILQVFTHLEFYDNASASRVCRRWKLLSEDQSLWQKISLNGREVPAKFIEKALRHGCQYLDLDGIHIEKVPGPNSFSVPNQLKYLSISCDNTDEHHEVLMKNLLGATQFLEKLSIRCDREYGCHFQPNILQNYQTLTVLRIVGLKSLTIETVKLIFTNCLELTEVSLEGCSMSVEALSFLCNHLTNKIKKLSLFRISAFDSEDIILEEEHVIALANRCHQLEELDLGDHKNTISEAALSTIIKKFQNLVKLRLPEIGHILWGNVRKLGAMPNLKYLHVPVDIDYGNLIKDFLKSTEADINLLPKLIEEWEKETPLVKALMEHLPNIKFSDGRFEIAAPDPCFLSSKWLWEIEYKPTNDFYEP